MRRPSRLTTLTLIATTGAVAVLAAGCGDDSSDPGAIATTVAATPGTSTSAAGAPTTAPAFPVTIEHQFGKTTIDEVPERVVSVGFGEHDGLLALGVIPVGVRDWYGDQPSATWPWAQDELGDAKPAVLPSTDLNFEQIAALDPDLILGISSGMTDTDYARLSAIAPTVAQPAGEIDFGTPWDVSMEMTGRAVGRSAEAAEVIAGTKQLFADARAEHPEFDGATAAVTFFYDGSPGAYASSDVRSRALTDLGFTIPEAIDEKAGDSFYVSISAEDLSLIDTDAVVWIGAGEEAFAAIRDLPTRTATRAAAEGRELVADDLLSAAFSHASPLSLEYALTALVPELALAVDGDPATIVPSAAVLSANGAAATTAPATTSSAAPPASTAASTSGTDGEAASATWAIVFDSTAAIDRKMPLLEDADLLQSTLAGYEKAGSAMGGIKVVPTGVEVSGDSATVTYDVHFGTTTAYRALTGTLVRQDGTWRVPRREFCSFMASARNACPA